MSGFERVCFDPLMWGLAGFILGRYPLCTPKYGALAGCMLGWISIMYPGMWGLAGYILTLGSTHPGSLGILEIA